ncbi:hypothetical protein H4R33_001878 [Dimargaris cristalligena]|nr:hypothetical protein H4R33_001878 [Dimargaris cristalligena]
MLNFLETLPEIKEVLPTCNLGLVGGKPSITIIDIRRQKLATDHFLAKDIIRGLTQPSIIPGFNPAEPDITPTDPVRTLPDVLIYDTHGLNLFDQLTSTEEYYITRSETSILIQESDAIAQKCKDHHVLVELGAGALRKTRLLLEAFDRLGPSFTYYALDLDHTALVEALSQIGHFQNINLVGLWGTYEDGMAYLPTLPSHHRKFVWWLGSSMGNFTPQDLDDFLLRLQFALEPGDALLLGSSGPTNPSAIHRAYHDSAGIHASLILNVLTHANHILGQPLFDPADFEYDCWYNPQCTQVEIIQELAHNAHLIVDAYWVSSDDYNCQLSLLSKPWPDIPQ